MELNLKELHDAAIEVARVGGNHTLQYFRSDLAVEHKEDRSPVTVADREAEQLMREAIQNRFPTHGIIGEEAGREHPGSPVQWILDPIDGTKTFIHGVPLYTTLVGVAIEDEPAVGVIYAPATGELCEAYRDGGARLNGHPCSVRGCASLSDATLLSENVTNAEQYGLGTVFSELLRRSRIHRTWGDGYGHMLVATGRADLMFEPVLNIWDAAPLLTVMREAGGVFSDMDGNETINSGNGFSCCRQLFPIICDIIKEYKQ